TPARGAAPADRNAADESSGKPPTTPSPTRPSRRAWAAVGRGARASHSAVPASSPASAARPIPTVTGPNAGTAARVAGNETLNARTPSSPQPWACRLRAPLPDAPPPDAPLPGVPPAGTPLPGTPLPGAPLAGASELGPPGPSPPEPGPFQPCARSGRRPATGSATGLGRIALFSRLMSNDSSIDRVAAELARLAAGGQPGDPLPGSREIGARLAVGPVTVSRAVARLVAQGVLVTE